MLTQVHRFVLIVKAAFTLRELLVSPQGREVAFYSKMQTRATNRSDRRQVNTGIRSDPYDR
jgi:hypothetical protein